MHRHNETTMANHRRAPRLGSQDSVIGVAAVRPSLHRLLRHGPGNQGSLFSTGLKARPPVSRKWKFVLGVTFRDAVASLLLAHVSLHAMESNNVEPLEIDLRRSRFSRNRNCGNSFVAGPRPAGV